VKRISKRSLRLKGTKRTRTMAFRIIRQRKEARRNAKLEEIFEERDKCGSGHISHEQLEDIYRVYQVDLDDYKASKIQDSTGQISREDFMNFAKETHLLDFECSAMGEAILLLSPRKSIKHPSTPKKNAKNKNSQKNENFVENHQTSASEDNSCSMLACFCSSDKKVESQDSDKMDKVEFAFRKYDSDGDGFLSWEEFQQLVKNLDQEQALRIFNSCNQSGTGLISLEEFRTMVNRKHSFGQQSVEEIGDDGVHQVNVHEG